MLEKIMKALAGFLLLVVSPALAAGTLSDNIRISSDILGYDLQYRVYVPESLPPDGGFPVLFVTDGPMYLGQGRFVKTLDRLLKRDRIEPVIVVFVDTIDPDDPGINRRNEQFFCNTDYLRFYVYEFIPAIEDSLPVRKSREARSILGVSFGGLNAACFGLLGYDAFHGIGMHSPANHPVEDLLPSYEAAPTLPLKIFLSTGAPNDNTKANRAFRALLKSKGYEMKYKQTDAGHDWSNWRPLIDDVLVYFYGRTSGKTR